MIASPIVPVMLGDESSALAAASVLLEQGLLVPAIRPPTVPEGTARLRISLTAAHTPADVARLVQALVAAAEGALDEPEPTGAFQE